MPAATMRAIAKLRPGPGLDLTEVPVPVPGINDVLIKGLRTSICGTDVHIDAWDPWAARTIKPPMVIGHEFVGRIAAVGANVVGYKPGRSGRRAERSAHRLRGVPQLPTPDAGAAPVQDDSARAWG